MNRSIVLAGASACALLLAATTVRADPPPAAAFGRVPALEDADISPDGAHLALLGANAQQKVVNIIGIDDQKVATLPLGSVDGSEVLWASNSSVLLGGTFLQKRKDDPKHVYHFYRHILIGTDGKVGGRLLGESLESEFITAIPIKGISTGDKPGISVVGLVDSGASDNSAHDSRLAKKEDDFVFALFRADPATGRGSVRERGNGATRDWLVDVDGDPRIRWDFDKSHTTTILARPRGASGYKVLWQVGARERDPDVLGYSTPEDAVYYRLQNKDGSVNIVRRSLSTGQDAVIGPKAPDRSASVKWDGRRGAAVALVSGAARGWYEWLDPELGAIHAAISKAFKGKRVEFVNWSVDRKRFLMFVDGASSPGGYYLYDAARGEVSPIQDQYPELKDAALGTKSFFTYKAADGLEIPAYLTLPPGAPASGGKLPLIVLPHGGPVARDDAGFDYLAQFIATRGYAVLQPQFRGSAGFGPAFVEAGAKEWAGKMQTDLLDGIKALADKGVIDPKRACIVGWSFGGYAALTGAALHRDAYRCAASINGVADLPRFIGEQVHSYGRESDTVFAWQKMMGDVVADGRLLADSSPIHHIDDIEAPILLIAGEEGTTVPFEQSASIKKALEDSGKPVQLVSFPGDDHYLHNARDRTAMLQALEAFLKQNLPVK